MIIANPIYDTVFKALLQDESIARFFIGTMLGENVIEVHPSQQEHVKFDDITGKLTLLRMDFLAVLRSVEGGDRKVLIELQKARNLADVLRFRNYLGEKYAEAAAPYPITSIYVLGFILPGIETACLKVSREYFDMVNNCKIEKKDPFVEHLTHDCYIVQAPRIKVRYNTPLDLILNFFEQDNFVVDEGTVNKSEAYKYFNGDMSRLSPEAKQILIKLEYFAADPEARKRLDEELYYLRYVAETFGESYAKIANQAATILAKEKAIAEQDEALAAKDEALAAKDEVLAAKDEALAAKDEALAKERAENERLRKLLNK